MRLEELKIIVTGGASGMGAHFAKRLHAAGAQVAVGDVNEAMLTELPQGIHRKKLDVAHEVDCADFVAWAHQKMGGLNALVNNAGIIRDGLLVKKDRETGAIKKLPTSDWNAVIAVNLTGVFLGVQAVVPTMKAAGRGSIINISSVEGMLGGAHLHGYVASKFGVRGLTKSLAVELGPDGIRVNSVHPGFVQTPMTARLDPTAVPIPLGRPALPEDVAGTVVFLAGDDSGYTTGTEHVVDGGMIAGVPHS